MKTLIDIKEEYESRISDLFGLEPGQIRGKKGTLVEDLAEDLLLISCSDLGISEDRISFDPVHVRVMLTSPEYLMRLPEEVGNYLLDNLDLCYHELVTDKNLSIDGRFILDVECKSYTENTMLKKIIQDCLFVRSVYPTVCFAILQLENSLGGDFGASDIYGSRAAHAIMSHFDLNIHIITLMDGNRHSHKPIEVYPKPLKMDRLEKSLDIFKDLISKSLHYGVQTLQV